MTLGGLLNFIRKSQYYDQDQINKLVQETHETSEPIVGDYVERRIVKYGDIREKINTFTTSNPDETNINTVERGAYFYRKKIPETVASYPLTHATTGTFTFQEGSGGKFGGGGVFDGATYITVNNQSVLNVTDEISFGGWFYLKSHTAASGKSRLLFKDTQYALQYHDSIDDEVRGFVYIGGTWYPVEYSYTPDNWVHLFVTWKSPNLKLYVNGSLTDTNTGATGTLNTSSNDLYIGSNAASEYAVNGTRASWLSILHKEVSSTWVSNHNGGVLDLSDGNNEILTIPFIGTELPKSVVTSGEFRST